MQHGFSLLVAGAVLLALCDGLAASPGVDAARSETALSDLVSSVETVSGNAKPGRLLRTSKFDEDDSDDRYDNTVDEERGSFKLPSLERLKLTRSKSLPRQTISEEQFRAELKDLNREMKKSGHLSRRRSFQELVQPDQVFNFFELDRKVVELMKQPNANKYKIWEEATAGDNGVKYGAYRLWDLFSQLYKKQQPNWASEITRSQ